MRDGQLLQLLIELPWAVRRRQKADLEKSESREKKGGLREKRLRRKKCEARS
jgi:hypothetical protein